MDKIYEKFLQNPYRDRDAKEILGLYKKEIDYTKEKESKNNFISQWDIFENGIIRDTFYFISSKRSGSKVAIGWDNKLKNIIQYSTLFSDQCCKYITKADEEIEWYKTILMEDEINHIDEYDHDDFLEIGTRTFPNECKKINICFNKHLINITLRKNHWWRGRLNEYLTKQILTDEVKEKLSSNMVAYFLINGKNCEWK